MAAAYSEHKSASAPQYAFKSGLTHTYVNYKVKQSVSKTVRMATYFAPILTVFLLWLYLLQGHRHDGRKQGLPG